MGCYNRKPTTQLHLPTNLIAEIPQLGRYTRYQHISLLYCDFWNNLDSNLFLRILFTLLVRLK